MAASGESHPILPFQSSRWRSATDKSRQLAAFKLRTESDVLFDPLGDTAGQVPPSSIGHRGRIASRPPPFSANALYFNQQKNVYGWALD
jgi:hypothetical protein